MTPPQKKIHAVLVATDFSRGSESALRRALHLPLAAGAKLCLLHVLPREMPQELRAVAENRARRHLRQWADRARQAAGTAGSPRWRLATKLAFGKPPVEIVRAARLLGADLVLVGRQGATPLRGRRIGATAIRVIREGDIPVLVVSRRPRGPYQRPLVAIPLEDTARAILDLALRVLGAPAAPIPVVHAYWPPFDSAALASLPPREVSRYHRDLKRQAEADLNRTLAALSSQPGRWLRVAQRGDPRTVVLEEARRRRSDLIVVGTHARSGLAHVLLGSVAEWLIRSAPCDVLVARPARFSFALP
ncbi:MAG TPA: universal stress protein [Terriglobia bacterium]|nr:universal stress protein [Terriglobia bacterium]